MGAQNCPAALYPVAHRVNLCREHNVIQNIYEFNYFNCHLVFIRTKSQIIPPLTASNTV